MQMRDLMNTITTLSEAPAVGTGASGFPTQGGGMAGKWPASPAEIKAYQKSKGLKPDGLIGKDTLAALHADGAKAPPGFVPAGNKAPAKKAGTDASGTVPIPSGGIAASTPAQAAAANAQQAPQGSDTTTAGDTMATAPAAPAAEPASPNVTPWGGTTAGTPPAAGTPFTAPVTSAPAATAAPASTAPAATAAPASTTPNPWEGTDPAKAAAWAALSPEDQKWIGKADPTDKNILARAPSNGGFMGSITPNFMKKKQPAPAAAPAPATTPAAPTSQTAAPPTMAETFDRMLELAGLQNITESKKKVLNDSMLNEAVGGLLRGAARAARAAKSRAPRQTLRKPSSPAASPKPGTAPAPATPPAAGAPKPGAAPATPPTTPPAPGSTTGNFRTRGQQRQTTGTAKPQQSPVPGISNSTWNNMSTEAQAAALKKLSKAELRSFNEKTRGAVAQWVMNNKGKTALVAGVALALGLDYALQPSDQPWDVAGAAERTTGRAWDAAKQAWSADYRPGGSAAGSAAGAGGAGGGGSAAPGASGATDWAYDTSRDTVPHYSTRKDLWQLKPGEDWADPLNQRSQPVKESQYRLFVKNPSTGKLIEVNLSKTDVTVHQNRQNYFESYHLGTSNGRTWTVSAWLNLPISKLLKGKE